MSTPITAGTGAVSVASEAVAGLQYQRIQLMGQGGASIASIDPAGALKVSVYGNINASFGNASVIAVPVGSVIAVIQGSVAAAQTGLRITSVVSANPSSLLVGASIFGQLPTGTGVLGSIAVLQATNPWNVIASVSGAMNVSGSVLLGSSNASVIAVMQGSVAAAQIGTTITSVVSSNPSSMLVGASIFGQLPAGTAVLGSIAVLQGTNPWIMGSVSGALNVSGSILLGSSNASVIVALQNSSLIAINAGSVVAIPTGSTIAVLQSSSILAVPVGSTIALLQSPSIVGTYAEDAAATSGDKGLFTLNVRNDTLASVTSNDGDYGALTIGPSGEGVFANAPFTKWVQGTADFRQGNAGASIIAIAAQGSSVFTYITGVQLANMGSASVLVTLASGGSILGYSIAPAGGGSNIYYPNGLKTPANFGFAGSLSGIASVVLSAQGFISKS